MKKYAFPVPGCGQCQHYQNMGVTRYCAGFKRRKPRRFGKSDPKFKAPKWCPKRIVPPICRIHGFKDDQFWYMDFLCREEYRSGQSKTIAPSSCHYVPRTEIPLEMTAKQLFDATQEGPLSGILPEKVSSGEIIEIDDGMQPYYFYNLDYATAMPLAYFHKLPSTE